MWNHEHRGKLHNEVVVQSVINYMGFLTTKMVNAPNSSVVQGSTIYIYNYMKFNYNYIKLIISLHKILYINMQSIKGKKPIERNTTDIYRRRYPSGEHVHEKILH